MNSEILWTYCADVLQVSKMYDVWVWDFFLTYFVVVVLPATVDG